MALPRRKKKFPVAQPTLVEDIGVPAPIKGIIAAGLYGGTADIGPESAIWLWNMVPGEFGITVRQGSREFATNLEDITAQPGDVRTMMYFNSTLAGGSTDFAFGVTDAGIYDITGGGAGPWSLAIATSLAWPNTGGNAGWCSFMNYTNTNGDHFLLVCDELNGYYIFDGTTWAQGSFTGNPAPDPVDLVQITEWQGRIWFVERDTATAWFLDPLALGGNITPMDVGTRFKKGGHLVQNSAWTLDDGAGMDDKFVMISSSGDVLVWFGVDPTVSDDLQLQGRWFVGSVPEGRRVMSDWGGDINIISTMGVVKLSALLHGDNALSTESHITANITRYIRAEMAIVRDEFGWSMESDPSQSISIISVPQRDESVPPIQFVINTVTKAWCMFRDLDIRCMDKNVTGFYFGTSDGRVMLSFGVADDVNLGLTFAKVINFSWLTHYWHMNSPAIWKRPQFIRPSWIGSAQPNYAIAVEYDFSLAELPALSTGGSGGGVSRWDTAEWDLNLWEGTAQSYFETRGLNGMGRHLAVAVRGNASSSLSYVGADLIMDKGGNL